MKLCIHRAVTSRGLNHRFSWWKVLFYFVKGMGVFFFTLTLENLYATLYCPEYLTFTVHMHFLPAASGLPQDNYCIPGAPKTYAQVTRPFRQAMSW